MYFSEIVQHEKLFMRNDNNWKMKREDAFKYTMFIQDKAYSIIKEEHCKYIHNKN